MDKRAIVHRKFLFCLNVYLQLLSILVASSSFSAAELSRGENVQLAFISLVGQLVCAMRFECIGIATKRDIPFKIRLGKFRRGKQFQIYYRFQQRRVDINHQNRLWIFKIFNN